LVSLPAPALVASAKAFPGGRFEATNLLDGNPATEYSSDGKGVETFLALDFGKPTVLAALEHVDRRDIATVAASKLTFSNTSDFSQPLGTATIEHANTRGGATLVPFPPVTARYVRWQITALGPKNCGTVGGAELKFYTTAAAEKTPSQARLEVASAPAVLKNGPSGSPLGSSGEGPGVRADRLLQPLRITIDYPYAEPVTATLQVSGLAPREVQLRMGRQLVEDLVPAVETETLCEASLQVAGQTVVQNKLAIKPVRHWTMYLLPHSHVDIGYTHVQTEIEKKHWDYLEQAIEIARRTADYPPEARFKWNSEVLWAIDSYLAQATPEKRAAAIDAVKRGWIHLDGLYGNELTGLCRPEELYRLADCARRLSRQYGLNIDAAMISDVPGYTWGIVPALAQSGIKYFSIGPNNCHRIGYTLEEWGDRPFYWVSPSGQDKLLCWMAGKAYSWFHPGLLGAIKQVQPQQFFDYLDQLAAQAYPYDLVQLRYNVGGDNGPPDADLPDYVKQWNEKYAWPRLVISTTSAMFQEFEHRYGDKIPQVRGDFTPYWEDGAGSSALETALTRTAAERLVAAEALWAMLNPKQYPVEGFYQAWRNVLLYNEHTWGAHCSISQPDSQLTRDQWRIKAGFALGANSQSRRLLRAALPAAEVAGDGVMAIEVYNTSSWPRTDLVILPSDVRVTGEAVKDADGRPVRSQRLSTGELAILAADVPPLGAKRLFFEPGHAPSDGAAKAERNGLASGKLRLSINEKTGAIGKLTFGDGSNLAGSALNDYVYVASRDPKNQKPSGPATITIQEAGPLVASLVVECEAPGCRRLVRQYRVVDGLDRVDLVNVVDKQPVRDKESVHFGFAFNLPGGVMRMDIPWAVIRPEQDQLAGACKNYFSVGRWIDVSNEQSGVTCATLDAPLAEVGAIAVDVLRPFEAKCFLKHLEPSQTFFSYAMNNYWETNYKADQDGRITFRYALRPHGPYDAAAAARFGLERSQPLITVPVRRDAPLARSLLGVEPSNVIVSLVKPTDDGQALLVRLMSTTDKPVEARLTWPRGTPKRLTLSGPFEQAGAEVTGPVAMPGYGIATLRAELPQ
jgi:hypothetical protein